MHDPAHPGEILREMYLEPMDVTITQAAEALDVTRKHVSAIINGRAPITPDMAIRLAAALRTDAEFWMNLQTQYDLWTEGKKPRPKVRPLHAET
jgi:addiction module HigA family antidote